MCIYLNKYFKGNVKKKKRNDEKFNLYIFLRVDFSFFFFCFNGWSILCLVGIEFFCLLFV